MIILIIKILGTLALGVDILAWIGAYMVGAISQSPKGLITQLIQQVIILLAIWVR